VTILERPTTAEQIPSSTRPAIGPAAVGVFGFALSFAFSWVPSLWFDEAATVSATSRSWSQLWTMLGNVDLVHGLYYAGMKVWFGVVGYTPLTLRLPSAVAVGVAAALVVLLVRQFGSRRLALIAGIVFCLLPRVVWMGTEGRSYALTAALATGLTLVFVLASRRRSTGWWVLYSALAILSTIAFLYLALLVVAHGVTILVRRGNRRGGLSWLIAAAAAGVVLLPFALLASRQSDQVDWITPLAASTWHGVFVSQWFYGDNDFAILAWVLIAGSIVMLLVRRRSDLLGLVIPWLVFPTAALIVASLVEPLYSARYVTFCAPAAAILMAVAIDALARRWLMAIALAACVILTAPAYVADRMPEAKQSSAWDQVAAFMSAQRAAEPAGTPEAVIWGTLGTHRVATSRVIEYSYPQPFEGLIDVTLKKPAPQTGVLWETRFLLKDVTSRLDGVPVVWLITGTEQDWEPMTTPQLDQLGYHTDGEWTFSDEKVVRYVR
jgi:mannosyltransferase